MSQSRPTENVENPIAKAQGRQILFYAPAGLLGGTFSCSRCGASGRQPDGIDHARDCRYRVRDESVG
jgi:hypothetical protein